MQTTHIDEQTSMWEAINAEWKHRTQWSKIMCLVELSEDTISDVVLDTSIMTWVIESRSSKNTTTFDTVPFEFSLSPFSSALQDFIRKSKDSEIFWMMVENIEAFWSTAKYRKYNCIKINQYTILQIECAVRWHTESWKSSIPHSWNLHYMQCYMECTKTKIITQKTCWSQSLH